MLKRLQDEEQLEDMRKRLYDRGTEVEKTVRHELSETKIDVNRDWVTGVSGKSLSNSSSETSVSTLVEKNEGIKEVGMAVEKAPKRRYRKFILVGSLLVFTLVAVVTGAYVYFGGNSVSSEKIEIAIEGQPLIGGGEVMNMQIVVTNQNPISIDSATLIIKYPPGTRSLDDPPRNLYEDRIELNQIESGGVQNIPINVVVYGEENAEHSVVATIEYRINGSNGMFYKEAEPLSYRISSSPLTIRVDNVEKVASGQLIDVIVTLDSNASTPLTDILLTAEYPNGFSLETADPEPVYGQNTWLIKELLPEQSAEIRLQGIVSGFTEEELNINFVAGPANISNKFTVDAVLDEVQIGFMIEKPFIDIDIVIGNDRDREVILKEGQESEVKLLISNTLDETVYDMVVEVEMKGNGIDKKSITSSSGFYNSNTDTIRWEVSQNANFERILPGAKRELSFSVRPGNQRTTASYELAVNVYARRVADSSALESLVGSNTAEVKYASRVNLYSQVGRNIVGYTDSGPVPPKVGEMTTYTLTLVAEAGANDLSKVVINASLPVYVEWLDKYDVDGEMSYNPVSKKIEWQVGDMVLGERKEFNLQVGFKPSISQINATPVLLNRQSVRANDGFTGSLLQNERSPVTTELSTEMGFGRDNGVVME